MFCKLFAEDSLYALIWLKVEVINTNLTRLNVEFTTFKDKDFLPGT